MRKHWLFLLMLLVLLLPAGAALAADALADGRYTVEATLSGGTGRAAIASPLSLTVTDGRAVAEIVWNSPYYTYMIVNNETYYPLERAAGAETSAFRVPVTLDTDIAVLAETAAMSAPHQIEYTLRLDAASVKAQDSGGSIWLTVLAAAVVLAVVVLLGRLLLAPRAR